MATSAKDVPEFSIVRHGDNLAVLHKYKQPRGKVLLISASPDGTQIGSRVPDSAAVEVVEYAGAISFARLSAIEAARPECTLCEGYGEVDIDDDDTETCTRCGGHGKEPLG